MVRLEALGEGDGVVLSKIRRGFESSSDERVRVNFIIGSLSSASGRMRASSRNESHDEDLEEGRGARASGTLNGTHCGVLGRGMGLRALVAGMPALETSHVGCRNNQCLEVTL
jgi:hypothetical protein